MTRFKKLPCDHAIALRVMDQDCGLTIGSVLRGSFMRGINGARGFFVEYKPRVYKWCDIRHFIPLNPARCRYWGMP